jgi:hypothetical protein
LYALEVEKLPFCLDHLPLRTCSFEHTSLLPSAFDVVFLRCGHLPLRHPTAEGQDLPHQLLVIVDSVLYSTIHLPPLLSLSPPSLSTSLPTKLSARAKQRGKQQRRAGVDGLGRKWQREKFRTSGLRCRTNKFWGKIGKLLDEIFLVCKANEFWGMFWSALGAALTNHCLIKGCRSKSIVS